MSILIKNMEMPKCCDVCQFCAWSSFHQTAACEVHDNDPCFDDFSVEYREKRSNICPLVEFSENEDAISRQGAIDVAFDIFPDDEYFREQFMKRIKALPSVQPKQDREFLKLTVRNSNGRPYYSIIYLEVDDNGVGHDFEGYSSYSLDVISDYLKKYFMPSAQPERESAKFIRWMECKKTDKYISYTPHCKCSKCENELLIEAINYCYMCGAKMEDERRTDV